MVSLLYVCVRPERGAADAEHRSFRRALGVPELARIDLIDRPLDGEADGFDGVVVGGSPFNVVAEERDAVQRRVEADLETMAQRALDGGTPAFFTCYGIGVVTRMLGGTVGTATPESTRPTTIRITAAGAEDPVFGPSAPELPVLTAHKEGSAEPPPGSVLLATNDDCPVQAYRVGSRLYATQFHPEVTPQDFVDRMAYYRSTGYFDPREYDLTAQRVLAASVRGTDLLRRFADRVAAR
ncbi:MULTISPECIES: glutamine amidotransferase-related protein [Microbacterium]|uniref:glutamine amidotransferase-related protein n=1 Tax=Microbacterium TaxID=33882 RepID=UPI00217E64FD|nr:MULTISPECIES: GMP synthase [Microbacterium]UWF77243.1 gamma-glutamyl-gamma-aminobutyrate hydrolase family protein [Microbacterium neungamense]WCM55398.1 gamma-glutamyl-gamma-aminobutyrate hydrolase family protein [Microbacterium sp. EF45047]